MSETTLDVVCYYFEPVKVPLLLLAAIPAAREAERLGVRARLERHWLYGPHVRVCLSGESAPVAEAAERAVGRLRQHVAALPSRVVTDEQALLDQAAVNGRADLVPPPYGPIHSDNTVVVESAGDRGLGQLLGSPQAVACRAELLRLSLGTVEVSARFLDQSGGRGGARVWVALTAMAAHASAFPKGGLTGGFHTFLSHLEDFLLYHDADGSLRARFDAEWGRRADRVVAQVEEIVAVGVGSPDPLAAAWSQWTHAARELCGPAYARGEISLYPDERYRDRARLIGDEPTARRWDPDLRTEYSDYHRLLGGDFARRLGIEQDFGPYRFATNVLYLLLGICDVAPVERCLSAYLLVEAVQRISGTSWRELMSGGSGASAPVAAR